MVIDGSHSRGISISDSLTKSKTQIKLIALLATAKPQTVSAASMGFLRKCYPSGKKYISLPGTISGEQELDTFTRKRSGVGLYGTLEKVAALPINCAISDRNKENP